MIQVCVDENLSSAVAASLHQLLPRDVKVRHVSELALQGQKDIELFADLASRHFDVLITMDWNQLENADEREALRRSGLVWVGVPDIDEAGLAMIATATAVVSCALPDILRDLPVTPTAFYLKRLSPKKPLRRTI